MTDLVSITQRVRAAVGDASEIDARIKFNFGDDGCVRIDAKADPAVVDNANSDADCTVKISKSDFIDMSTGKLDSMSAFMTGKLKIEGDMGIAMQLGTILS